MRQRSVPRRALRGERRGVASEEGAAEGGAGGVGDEHSDEVAGLCVAFGEDHHLVLTRAPYIFVGASLRASLYKHFHLLTHILVVALGRELVLKRYHAVKALYLYLFRNIIREIFGGIRAGALGIFKHEGGVEAGLPHQGESLLEILLRFAVETGEKVGRESGIGENATDSGHAIEIPFASVFPVHQLQHGVASALHGEMAKKVSIYPNAFNYNVQQTKRANRKDDWLSESPML